MHYLPKGNFVLHTNRRFSLTVLCAKFAIRGGVSGARSVAVRPNAVYDSALLNRSQA